ncbi:MAG: GDP-mannose 4,6-dehydratase [Candidatus Bathyarchaeia archaeon]
MRTLITGIQGFIGWHLSEFLKSNGHEVTGIQRTVKSSTDSSKTYECDMLNEAILTDILRNTAPTVIFHLAAQSLPSVSWESPQRTITNNVISTVNLLRCIQKLHMNTRLILFGSSSEYAPSVEPIREDSPLKPSSPYAVSKIASSLLSRMYYEAFGIDIIIARPFFIIGPRKTHDVCSSFARGIVKIETKRERTLTVGNLNAIRDFLDADDAVRAIWTLSQKGESGEVYNVSSGIGTPIKTALEILRSNARTTIPTETSHAENRKLDLPVVIGNNQKLRTLDWNPSVSLAESLSRILDYWRNHP